MTVAEYEIPMFLPSEYLILEGLKQGNNTVDEIKDFLENNQISLNTNYIYQILSNLVKNGYVSSNQNGSDARYRVYEIVDSQSEATDRKTRRMRQ